MIVREYAPLWVRRGLRAGGLVAFLLLAGCPELIPAQFEPESEPSPPILVTANVDRLLLTTASETSSYVPGGRTLLEACAVMTDGTFFRHASIWDSLSTTASIGSVERDAVTGDVAFHAPSDALASLGQTATISVCLKARPYLAVSLALAPDYACGMLCLDGREGAAVGPNHLGDAGEDAPEATVGLSGGTGDAARLVLARFSAGGRTGVTVFDPTRTKLKVSARGGQGGRGGDGQSRPDIPTEEFHLTGGRGGKGGAGGHVILLYDRDRPELRDLVEIIVRGGDGGAGGQGGKRRRRRDTLRPPTTPDYGPVGPRGTPGESGPPHTFRAVPLSEILSVGAPR